MSKIFLSIQPNRQGPKDKTTVNIIAEVGPKLRNVALAQKRLFIGFRSVDVRDYLVVAKCNKCKDLGHSFIDIINKSARFRWFRAVVR
jgi:hypothetical protein